MVSGLTRRALPVGGGVLSFCGKAFRYTAIAFASSSVMYCRLLYTTSAIGPYTVPRCETPDCSRSVISLIVQFPNPASLFEVSEGAYQFWFGIMPPSKAFASLDPPSRLTAVWHIAQ